MALSGPAWVPQFPNSSDVEDLAPGFREGVKKFLAALRTAGASVAIANTLRRPERAYLMHFSFRIAREGLSAASVPARPGVDIQWVHPDSPAVPSAKASKEAAELMVAGYGIVFKPALNSRHTEGNAIDMTIKWTGDLVIRKADGTDVTITSAPRTGDNASLHRVGESYGVFKLATDPPHWSTDGH